MLTPLRDKLFVEVQIPERRKGVIHLPDKDTIKICNKCEKMMEEIDDRQRCFGEDDFKFDKIHDRLIYKGTDYSHDIEYLEWPAHDPDNPDALKAMVVAVGSEVKDIHVGDIIAIPFSAGGCMDMYRTIRECEALAFVEEP